MPDTTTYKGLTVPVDTATGQGGIILIDGLKGLADRVGIVNWTATTNPGVNNDNTQGYSQGSQWYNTSQGRYYTCLSATTAAAVWRETVNFANAQSNLIAAGSLTVQAAGLTVNSTSSLVVSATTTNTISGASIAINSASGNIGITSAAQANISGPTINITATTDLGAINITSPNTANAISGDDANDVPNITFTTGNGGTAVNGDGGSAGSIFMNFGIAGNSTNGEDGLSGGLYLNQLGTPNQSQFVVIAGSTVMDISSTSNFNWYGNGGAGDFNWYSTGDTPGVFPGAISFKKASGRLSFNLASPDALLHIFNDQVIASSITSTILEAQTDTPASTTGLTIRKSRVSAANLATNDSAGTLNYDARFNSTWGTIANVESQYTGSGLTQLGHLIFKTANSGAPTEVLRVTNTGIIVGAAVTSTVELIEARKDQNAKTGVAILNTNGGTGAFSGLHIANTTDHDNGGRLLVFGTGFTTSSRFIQNSVLLEAGGNLGGDLNFAAAGLNAPIRFYISNAASVPMMILNHQNRMGINKPTPLATLHVQTPTTGDLGCIIQATAAQTVDQLQCQASTTAVGLRINKDNYLIIKKLTAIPDGDLAASELAIWLDDTPGTTRAMFKAKDSGGTVRTGSINLT